jgi:hypothetical protein
MIVAVEVFEVVVIVMFVVEFRSFLIMLGMSIIESACIEISSSRL